jgi:DNA-binding response OmpR family regulator
VASRPTVLICEDEPQLRELIRISLGEGYDAVEVATVAEAEEALVTLRPDVALVDLMLPGGSGLDVVRAVRANEGATVPVVVVTAWATDEHRTAADEAGATAFVSKPFAPDELAAVVRRLLEAAAEP